MVGSYREKQMSSSKSNKRKHRARNTLQEKGIAITALGFFFLIFPWFTGSSPMLKAIADSQRAPDCLAMKVCYVLNSFLRLFHEGYGHKTYKLL